MQLEDIDLYDPDSYVDAVPHEMFATLRREAPVYWHEKPDDDGFWCVTRHADIVHGEPRRLALLVVGADRRSWRCRRPKPASRCAADDAQHGSAAAHPAAQDRQPRASPRSGSATSWTSSSSGRRQHRRRDHREGLLRLRRARWRRSCPLQAIAEFLGVPQEDRRMIFDWSNRLIGFDDPEFRTSEEQATEAAGEIYAYAEGLAAERIRPTPATTSSRRSSPPRSTARRSPPTSSTCSSCCSPWPATRPPATPSPTGCSPSSSTPTSGSACSTTRRSSTPRSRRSSAGPLR